MCFQFFWNGGAYGAVAIFELDGTGNAFEFAVVQHKHRAGSGRQGLETIQKGVVAIGGGTIEQQHLAVAHVQRLGAACVFTLENLGDFLGAFPQVLIAAGEEPIDHVHALLHVHFGALLDGAGHAHIDDEHQHHHDDSHRQQGCQRKLDT